MQSSHGHSHAGRSESIGDGIGFPDLGRKRADGDQVKAIQLRGLPSDPLGLKIMQLVPRWGGGGNAQQT
jgi:hypothetical protein